jgi:cysteine desulfurase
MGVDPKVAHGAIRFSLSRYTTDAELNQALQVLPGVIQRLKAVMPTWDNAEVRMQNAE